MPERLDEPKDSGIEMELEVTGRGLAHRFKLTRRRRCKGIQHRATTASMTVTA